ncbi:MAG: hypothetical protein KY433_10760 [Actinobacteria bacterium]|nr:hypothetical protein [Actinomycetota bacterium]
MRIGQTALDELLGTTARTHLDRDELAPLLRRTDGSSPLEVLARLFVLGIEVDLRQARQAGVPCHAIVGENAIDRFDARILDLQAIVVASTLAEIERAGEELAAYL